MLLSLLKSAGTVLSLSRFKSSTLVFRLANSTFDTSKSTKILYNYINAVIESSEKKKKKEKQTQEALDPTLKHSKQVYNVPISRWHYRWLTGFCKILKNFLEEYFTFYPSPYLGQSEEKLKF